jgi:hypothetical protein
MDDKKLVSDIAWTALGFFLLLLVVLVFGTLFLFVSHFWLPLTVIGIVAFAGWFLTFGPAGQEISARFRTQALLLRLKTLNMRAFPGADRFGAEIALELGTLCGLDDRATEVLERVASDLYFNEGFEARYLGEPPSEHSSIEGARYREALRGMIEGLANPAVVSTFRDAVMDSLSVLASALPQGGEGAGYLSFDVPLAAVARNLPAVVMDTIVPFYSEAAIKHRLFVDLRKQLDLNLHELSNVPLDQKDSPRLVMPEKYKGTNLIGDYLDNTPLRSLFEAPATISIPDERRFEHMHIVAGTGHGKTQTLQRLILGDLQTTAGLVIIDSQGEMLRKIAELDCGKEIIHIDPTDLEHPPALNMFDVSRLDGLPPVKREQFLNGLIELLEYVFAGLLKAELTQKQNVLFRYTLRLMLAVPGATMLDLVKFLSDPTPYLPYARELNPMAQEFFAEEFQQKSYVQTREQIRRRLYGVLENDSFRRMFSAERNELSLPEALNRGAVVLVDTAKSHLKSDASSLMGRYFIALTLQAALEREGNQNPAFLYIDEAGEYFDDNIDSLLNEARKRRVGIIMAHQYLDQLTPQLRASIATNTAVKLAGGVSDRDARTLAADMRCDPQVITSQPTGHFACYIKNVTAQAVSIHVPFGVLEAQPKRPAALPGPTVEIEPSQPKPEPPPVPEGLGAGDAVEPVGSEMLASEFGGRRLPPAVPLIVPKQRSISAGAHALSTAAKESTARNVARASKPSPTPPSESEQARDEQSAAEIVPSSEW